MRWGNNNISKTNFWAIKHSTIQSMAWCLRLALLGLALYSRLKQVDCLWNDSWTPKLTATSVLLGIQLARIIIRTNKLSIRTYSKLCLRDAYILSYTRMYKVW
ncbi:uncharacterized protein ACN2A1_007860 isoform 1-T1 [Glossina fuscipes fuscipes]